MLACLYLVVGVQFCISCRLSCPQVVHRASVNDEFKCFGCLEGQSGGFQSAVDHVGHLTLNTLQKEGL